jgi:iron complex transport system permease protein
VPFLSLLLLGTWVLIFWKPTLNGQLLQLEYGRVALAFATGMLLAQSGWVTQTLFQNPLVEPNIIGISAGASLGAVLASLWVPYAWMFIWMPVCAFSGGLLISLLVYWLAVRKGLEHAGLTLLIGISCSMLIQALIMLARHMLPPASLQWYDHWLVGTLVDRAPSVQWGMIVLALLLHALFQTQAKRLHLLLLGDKQAHFLGVHVHQVKLLCLMAVALGTSFSVATCGYIGFVGLLVPNVVRHWAWSSTAQALTAVGFLGGMLLVLADWVASQVMAPAELPVGLMTALIGTPLFVTLIYVQRQVR